MDKKQKLLASHILNLVTEINTLMLQAHKQGDLVRGSAGLAYTPDGPQLDFTIDDVKDAFWKEQDNE